MDPIQFLYHAAYLNDKGCSLMESGKQHEAFETFIQAIESISTLTQVVEARRQQLQHRTLSLLPSQRRKSTMHPSLHGGRRHNDTASSSSGGYTSVMKTSDFRLCDEDVERFEMGTTASHQCCASAMAGSNVNFVCNRSFRFTPRESHLEHCDETAVHYLKLCQAGITFNSALSFHQRSIGANERLKGTAESVAADLYLDAMNLLKDCFSTPDSCRVLVATLNNAAILFYEMKCYDKFTVFQTELHRLLVDIESSFPQAVDPQYLQCFFFNATLLSTPATAAAA